MKNTGRCRGGGFGSATDLVVDLAGGHGGVAQVLGVAVGQVEAAGGGDAIGRVVDAAGPAGVVVDAAAAQLVGLAGGGGGRGTGDAAGIKRAKAKAETKPGTFRFFHQFLKVLFSRAIAASVTGEFNLRT